MANYSFKKEVEVFILSGGNRHKIDVGEVNFSQTFSEASYPVKTLHDQNRLFEGSVINKANPANFSFNFFAIAENDFSIVETLMLTVGTFDLFVKTAADIFKVTNCVITNGTFVIEKSRPLSIEIQGEGSRVLRGQTLQGSLQSRNTTKTYSIPQSLFTTINNTSRVYVVSHTLELQNDIEWTPYTTVNAALDVTTAGTTMYPSSFSLSKKILSGTIVEYLSDINTGDAQTWGKQAPIEIKAGNGLSGPNFRGFHFGPAQCSFTNRINSGNIFTQSYDWRMTQIPNNLGSFLRYVTDNDT